MTEIEKIGLFVFCLTEIILYWLLVAKPKMQKHVAENYVSKELYKSESRAIFETLAEIKADLKELLKGGRQ